MGSYPTHGGRLWQIHCKKTCAPARRPYTSRIVLRRIRHNSFLLHATALVVMVHFLLAMAMASSPDLHKRFHGDADNDEHECLVTAMHHGGCGDAAPIVTFVMQGLPETNFTLPASALVTLDSIFKGGSISERGPPVLS